ncbi:Cell division protein FtsI/penicillin-binding protein 2 [Prauserella aidingensis]|uniref:penicillin-binding transpeptidase domain-containing protein n=1 Tax=Prauserella aidingensis TaxID=387890 RepID=UPI0020A3D6A6|nr:penicillin-binding transpeptidase domain-containing protein [Prauserella aidingensis]MCP2252432.1 Cell division protein FtsI/penicillin-binding protein 2 [Prauserella aidingensis]
MARPTTATALALTAVLALSGCSVFGGNGAENALDEFLTAWQENKPGEAAALTDTPGTAEEMLRRTGKSLGAESMSAETGEVTETAEGERADGRYSLTWKLGDRRTWRYDAQAELRSTDDGWKVHFAPTVVHPDLGAQQSLSLVTATPPPAPVLDRNGAALLKTDTVIGVTLDRKAAANRLDEVAGTLAGAVSRFDDSITKRSILKGARETEDGSPYLVVSLRSADYQSVKPQIYELPGVRFTSQQRLLSAERGLGAKILPMIRNHVSERVAGKDGWRVVVNDSAGAEVRELHAVDARPAAAVHSTMSLPVQQAAERALQNVDGPAAIVAIRPSNGDLLAVAQNDAADQQGAIALTGRYPPGSTLKMATAAAALDAGETRPNATVACPATTTIGHRRIPNENNFDLGRVPLHTAFAESCNTTFSQLSAKLPADALTESARSLGIGADFVIPGITTITGSVPESDDRVQRAENGIGQGKTLASPFGMALAAATVDAGEMPTPGLIRGDRTKASKTGEPLPGDVLRPLRRMMREVVTDGTATALRDLSAVHGKTGTAQYGDGSDSHGWFAGYGDAGPLDDVAFATLLTGAGSSKPAVDVTRDFLAGLR